MIFEDLVKNIFYIYKFIYFLIWWGSFKMFGEILNKEEVFRKLV